jgi:hypothetical protein
MFVLAHLSDLHMALRPRLFELAGKRGLGYINWHRSRKYIHRRDTLDGAANIRYLAWRLFDRQLQQRQSSAARQA